MAFDGALTLEVFSGQDLSQTVRFDTNYESLANGEFSDSSESYSNAIYIGGKGQNDDRDIYEGEDGTPEGLDRFESWDNQSSLTVESEYEAEALVNAYTVRTDTYNERKRTCKMPLCFQRTVRHRRYSYSCLFG